MALVGSDEGVRRQRAVGDVGGQRVSVDVPAAAVFCDAEPGDAWVVSRLVWIGCRSLARVRHGWVVRAPCLSRAAELAEDVRAFRESRRRDATGDGHVVGVAGMRDAAIVGGKPAHPGEVVEEGRVAPGGGAARPDDVREALVLVHDHDHVPVTGPDGEPAFDPHNAEAPSATGRRHHGDTDRDEGRKRDSTRQATGGSATHRGTVVREARGGVSDTEIPTTPLQILRGGMPRSERNLMAEGEGGFDCLGVWRSAVGDGARVERSCRMLWSCDGCRSATADGDVADERAVRAIRISNGVIYLGGDFTGAAATRSRAGDGDRCTRPRCCDRRAYWSAVALESAGEWSRQCDRDVPGSECIWVASSAGLEAGRVETWRPSAAARGMSSGGIPARTPACT